MTNLAITLPQIGQPDTTEDPKLVNNFTNLASWANGNIDATNLSATAAQAAGMNQSGQTVKGQSIVATSQNTGSTTYTTLGTPDQVAGIVLPTNGLIAVWYQATWQESVSGAARAAIFIGANQLKWPGASLVTAQAAATNSATANTNLLLSTSPLGLGSNTAGTYPGDASTGQIVGSAAVPQGFEFNGSVTTDSGFKGGPCWVFATAGTFTVSVQFKASSGTVTAANRKLWVAAFSFA